MSSAAAARRPSDAPPTAIPGPPPPSEEATLLSERDKAFSVAAALLGLFLAALDQTIVSTALPKIVSDLHGLELFSWVTTSYLLASTAMVPIYGKLSDIYGRRNILLVGIVLFLASSVACGAAHSMEFLIAMRGVQGLGAAALTSTAFVVVADLYEMPRRARIQGFFGAVFGLSSVVGPLLGGYLTDHLSWRWVFYVNLPIGAVAVAFIIAKMPALRSGRREPIDYLGSLLLVAFTVPLLLGMTLDHTKYPWNGPETIGLIASGLVALGLFLFAETRAASPVLPLGMFRSAPYAIGMALSFVFGGTFLGSVLFIPLFLQRVVGVSASESGTAMTPLTVGLVIAAITSGRVAAKVGKGKPFVLAGLVIVIASYWLLSTMTADTTYGGVVWRMVILGIGLGPAMPLLNLMVQNLVEKRQIGVATGVRQFFQQLGSVFGAAVMGAMLTAGLQTQIPKAMEPVLAKLPPQARAQAAKFSPSQSARFEEGAPGAADAVPPQFLAPIEEGHRSASAALDSALANHDPASLGRLLGDPTIPPPVKALVQAPPEAPPTPEQVAAAHQALDAQRDERIVQAREIGKEFKEAIRQGFSTALTQLFLLGIGLAVLAFLLLLAFREAPFEKGAPAAAAPVEL